MFFDNSGLKLKTSNTKIFGKASNNWKLNNALLNNQCIKEEITKDIVKYFELNDNKNTHIKT